MVLSGTRQPLEGGAPQPFPSWTLNEDTTGWEPPTPRPEGHVYWDEDTLSWVEVE